MDDYFTKLNILLKKTSEFKTDIHNLLSTHESAFKHRVKKLEDSYKKLKGLSIKQNELFEESLKCLENELYRSAIILAWISFMDFILDFLEHDKFIKLNSTMPKWSISTREQLIETQTDYNIIVCLYQMGACSKTEKKALHGLLNKRNECAHPTSHDPDFNESLGYVSEIFSRIKLFKRKNKF